MLTLKHSPLFDSQKKSGAKFTEFAGWEMPVLYTSIIEEHHAVRKNAGIFDISHMGKVFIRGEALKFLQKICTNDLSKCPPGKAMYSHICNQQGGVIDDIFVYCLSEKEYMVIVNAATVEKDFEWFLKHTEPKITIENKTAEFGMIALQGPKSEILMQRLLKEVPQRHQVIVQNFSGESFFLCRTGYTGEDGFEIVAPNSILVELWETFLKDKDFTGIRPCGLGARDTLRLEVGYLLYGHDVDEEHTPLEAGVSWVVKLAKPDFIGKAMLEQQKKDGLKRKLTGFRLMEKGIPRYGNKIYCDSKEAGTVASGTFSPSLQYGIAIGYIPTNLNGKYFIDCHHKLVPAEITALPFYPQR